MWIHTVILARQDDKQCGGNKTVLQNYQHCYRFLIALRVIKPCVTNPWFEFCLTQHS